VFGLFADYCSRHPVPAGISSADKSTKVDLIRQRTKDAAAAWQLLSNEQKASYKAGSQVSSSQESTLKHARSRMKKASALVKSLNKQVSFLLCRDSVLLEPECLLNVSDGCH